MVLYHGSRRSVITLNKFKLYDTNLNNAFFRGKFLKMVNFLITSSNSKSLIASLHFSSNAGSQLEHKESLKTWALSRDENNMAFI